MIDKSPFGQIGFKKHERKRLRKVADHRPSRSGLCAISVAIGVLAGFANMYLGIDFPLRASLFSWLLVAILVVVALHEGTHGAVAALLGHKPLFGVSPPLVYITFPGKVPRGHYMLVAIAPFVMLTPLFAFLYARGALKLFWHLSLLTNVIGSVGDLWAVIKLAGAPKGAWIQDTKTGFEVWLTNEAQPGPESQKEN